MTDRIDKPGIFDSANLRTRGHGIEIAGQDGARARRQHGLDPGNSAFSFQ